MKFDKKYYDCAFDISCSIILFIFLIYLFSTVGFIFHIPINVFYPILSFFICIIFLLKREESPFAIKTLGIILFFTIILLITAITYPDSSWDGRIYHQQAIVALIDGWNPIFQAPFSHVFNNFDTWVEHYPKFCEIVSSNFALLFHNIEAGKFLNGLLALNLFLLSFYSVSKLKNIKLWQNITISLLLVLNPVLICQFSTYYNDFIIYILFASLILIMYLKTCDNKPLGSKGGGRLLLNSIFVMNLVMLTSAKTIGLLYLIIFPIVFFLYDVYCEKNAKNALEYIIVFIVSVALFAVTNINPYFTNIAQGKHFLHPLAGKEKIDIMHTNTPLQLQNKNYFYKTFVGLFTSTQNITGEHNSDKFRFKIPFSVVNQERFCITDMRLGGFGYFWGGILILVFGYLIADKIKTREKPKKEEFLLWFILLTVFLNPENWWARYIPQFWMVPLFIITYCINNEKLSKYKKYFLYLLLILFAINSTIVICQNYTVTKYYKKETRRFYRALKKAPLVYIYTIRPTGKLPDFLKYLLYVEQPAREAGFFEKLKERNIKYTTVSDKHYQENKENFKEIPYPAGPVIKYATKCENCNVK